MPTYDPLASEVTVDVTIGAVTYIVTAFSDNGASAVGSDFQNSDGSYRGNRKVSGPRDGSITIERQDAAQALPTQFATITYKGVDWFIQSVGAASSSTGPATVTLSLREVSTAEAAA